MFKGYRKINLIVMAFLVFAAGACGVKTDPVPPVVPVEMTKGKSTEQPKTDQDSNKQKK